MWEVVKKFEKFHGLGNGFVVVSHENVAGKDLSQLAFTVCCRKTGIGVDSFIVSSLRGEIPEMIFYNTMCGNGFRGFCLSLKNNSFIKDKKQGLEFWILKL